MFGVEKTRATNTDRLSFSFLLLSRSVPHGAGERGAAASAAEQRATNKTEIGCAVAGDGEECPLNRSAAAVAPFSRTFEKSNREIPKL